MKRALLSALSLCAVGGMTLSTRSQTMQELLDDGAQGVDVLPAGHGSGLRGCERGGPEKQGGEERAFHDD